MEIYFSSSFSRRHARHSRITNKKAKQTWFVWVCSCIMCCLLIFNKMCVCYTNSSNNIYVMFVISIYRLSILLNMWIIIHYMQHQQCSNLSFLCLYSRLMCVTMLHIALEHWESYNLHVMRLNCMYLYSKSDFCLHSASCGMYMNNSRVVSTIFGPYSALYCKHSTNEAKTPPFVILWMGLQIVCISFSLFIARMYAALIGFVNIKISYFVLLCVGWACMGLYGLIWNGQWQRVQKRENTHTQQLKTCA